MWTGGVTNGGYGQWMTGGRRTKAHRWAYELMVGPIPDGLVVDHTCHNADAECPGGDGCLHRRCVNPDHLEPVTTWANTMRSDRTPGAMNAAKTHCPKGHPYDVIESVGGGKRGRRCTLCRRAERGPGAQ